MEDTGGSSGPLTLDSGTDLTASALPSDSDESLAEEPKKRDACSCCSTKCCCRSTIFLVSSFGMTTFILLYLIVGAVIFTDIERPEELRTLIQQRTQYLEYRAEHVDELYQRVIDQGCVPQPGLKVYLSSILSKYAMNMNNWDFRVGDTDEITEENCVWSFVPAFIFCISVVTTIGYGDIVPMTSAGRFATIVYAIIGIPCTLISLANIGTLSAMFLKVSLGRVISFCKKKTNQRRKKSKDISKEEEQHENSDVASEQLERMLEMAKKMDWENVKDGTNNAMSPPASVLSFRSAMSKNSKCEQTETQDQGSEVEAKSTYYQLPGSQRSTVEAKNPKYGQQQESQRSKVEALVSQMSLPNVSQEQQRSSGSSRSVYFKDSPDDWMPTATAEVSVTIESPVDSLTSSEQRRIDERSASRVDDVKQLVTKKAEDLKKLQEKKRQELHRRRIEEREKLSERYSVKVAIPEIPIYVSILLLVGYVLLGGVVFSTGGETYRGFDFTTGCYFSFITLTTIGFGDFIYGTSVAPGQKHAIRDASNYDATSLLATAVYIMFGLALASMCIDLMHNGIKRKFDEIRIGVLEKFERYKEFIEKHRASEMHKSPEGAKSKVSAAKTMLSLMVLGKTISRDAKQELKPSSSMHERVSVGETHLF